MQPCKEYDERVKSYDVIETPLPCKELKSTLSQQFSNHDYKAFGNEGRLYPQVNRSVSESMFKVFGAII